MKSRRLVVGLTVGFAASVLATVATSPAPRAAAATPQDSETTRAQGIRADYGLNTDPEHVRQVANRPDKTYRYLGIPLTPDEGTQLDLDIARSARVGSAVAGFASDPGFGGAWWVFRARQVAVAVTSDATPGLADRFADRVEAGIAHAAVPVAHSYMALQDAWAKANEAAYKAGPRGRLRWVSLNDWENRVVVGVERGALVDDRRGVEGLSPAIVTEDTDRPAGLVDTLWDGVPPLRGGKQILREPTPGSYITCSIAGIGAGSNGYYAISAGHCAAAAGVTAGAGRLRPHPRPTSAMP